MWLFFYAPAQTFFHRPSHFDIPGIVYIFATQIPPLKQKKPEPIFSDIPCSNMRVAHLILTYTDPLQTERMIKHLYHPDFDFYIHVDKKIGKASHQFLTRMPQVYLIENTTNVVWAGYNTVEAILRSCKEIIASGKGYDYIHLMSGQDYPIKAPSVIHQFFEKNNGSQFLKYEHFDTWDGEGYKRISNYHLTNYRIPGKYLVQQLFNRCLPKRRLPELEFYGYSMFWALTPDCIQYVIAYLRSHHSFRKFMKLSWGCDEFIFQTIILNSIYKDRVLNDNLLYYQRPFQSAHPNILVSKDFSTLIHSGKLFARKLSLANDPEIFNMLDEHIREDKIGSKSFQPI
jgi:Core-2/I-Branching enzyme